MHFLTTGLCLPFTSMYSGNAFCWTTLSLFGSLWPTDMWSNKHSHEQYITMQNGQIKWWLERMQDGEKFWSWWWSTMSCTSVMVISEQCIHFASPLHFSEQPVPVKSPRDPANMLPQCLAASMPMGLGTQWTIESGGLPGTGRQRHSWTHANRPGYVW